MTTAAPFPVPDAAPNPVPARALLAAGLASLALRLFISVTLPITGDEAFFYWWGVVPAWGYSDHPPMVGWVIALARAALGDSIWAIRLPAVLLPLGVGAALWWGLKGWNRQHAAWAVLLYWLAPLNWLNALITTDTPLIFWSAWSVAALLRAERRPQLDRRAYGLYALSGAFLACAFLSKYFSVVLGLAYLVYFVLYRRERLGGLVLLVVCALPGPAINIAYNMSHGWSNIMFNLYNRNAAEVFEWRKPLTYLGMLAYLATPVGVWLAFRHRSRWWAAASASPGQRLLACAVLVPLVFFAALTAKKIIGLHWILSFYPLVFAVAAFSLPADALRKAALGLAAFVAVHAAVVAGLYLTDLDTWKTHARYPQIVRSVKTADMLAQVTAPGVVLMAEAYTPASIFGFERRQYMPVFGVGRFHARQDDALVDFSVYRGQTIRIITANPPRLEDFRPYFSDVKVLAFTQSGVNFYAVEGTDFNFDAYRSGVLGTIFKRFYNIPKALPMTGCPFCERYCGQVRCP